MTGPGRKPKDGVAARKLISLRLPASWVDAIRSLARRQGISQADAAVQLLETGKLAATDNEEEV